MKNDNCDNNKCLYAGGKVRLLQGGGGGNLILCRACYQFEINYRNQRNRDLDADHQFLTPEWRTLEVYEPDHSILWHEDFPASEWKYAVACGDTCLGYAEWVWQQKKEAERCELSNNS